MSHIMDGVDATEWEELDSNAVISALARSSAVAGVVTWALMLLSRHHFTKRDMVISEIV